MGYIFNRWGVHDMIPNINIGDTLYHKYLGEVIVKNLNECGINVDTITQGMLEFNFYDFGRVLYYKKEHSNKDYKTCNEYLEFCEKEKKVKQENEQKKFIQAKIDIQKEEENQKVIDAQRKEEIKQKKVDEKQKSNIEKYKVKYSINKENISEIKLKINELKEKYNFQGLWHFTDFTNLKSIFRAGELSGRKLCLDNNMQFLDGANSEIINKANEFVHSCTRFYYRPKTPTLYDNEGIKPIQYSSKIHIPRPVYLLFSEELIYDNDTLFSNGNATNSPIDNTIEFFNGMDWESIFHSTWFQPEARDYIINKRHAELLSKTPVKLKYLTNIIFRSEADLKQAIRLWGKNDKFIVNENYFSDKNNLLIIDWRYNNYIKKYKIDYSTNILALTIWLKRPLWNYSISYEIEDGKGKKKTNLLDKLLDIRFKNELNNETDRLEEAINAKLVFNYKPLSGDIMKIYLNNILCVEEIVVR